MSLKTKILIVAAVLLLCGLIAGYVRYEILRLRTAFAEEQVSVFYQMRDSALASVDPREAVGFLEYAFNYYPSGTKQPHNSRLDRLVEMVRSDCLRDIIEDLRKKTGQDFGIHPTNWYRHYPPPRP